MSIFRIYSKKNNTIASGSFENFNSGQNAVSELWYGGIGQTTNSISRYLIKFPMEELATKIAEHEIMSGNVISYTLKMKNSIPRDVALESNYGIEDPDKIIASSFDLIVFPINKNWDEGRGYDLIKEDYIVKQKGNPLVTGYSNWNYATSTIQWDEPGVFANPTASTFCNRYSGSTNYLDTTFEVVNTSLPEIYNFSIISSTTHSNKSDVLVSGNDIEYTYNPLSGDTIPDYYSGETIYNGLTFTKENSLTSEIYNFNILINDSLITNHEVTTTGNTIDFTFNSLSGIPTTLEYKVELLNNIDFNLFNIDIIGGDATLITGGDSFVLNVGDLTAGYTTAFEPTTEDYINSLNVSAFSGLNINVFGGSSLTNLLCQSFSLSSTTISENQWSIQHFDLGNEDIEMDITNIVNAWLTGEKENHGLCVAYSRDFELLSTNTRSVSSFYTNKTNSCFKPFIEVKYNQVINDDREQVSNNRVNRLFLYTFSGNNYANFYSASTVTIKAPNGSDAITGLTPTQFQKGVYYVDVSLPNATRGQRYSDVWSGITFVQGLDRQDYVQYFNIQDNFYLNSSPSINDYTLNIYGLEGNSILTNDENIVIFAHVRTNYSKKEPAPYYSLSYRLIMNNQEEVIPWTPLNKTVRNKCQENSFNLDTSWLLNNQSYKIEFKIEELGSKRVMPNEIVFRVQRSFN